MKTKTAGSHEAVRRARSLIHQQCEVFRLSHCSPDGTWDKFGKKMYDEWSEVGLLLDRLLAQVEFLTDSKIGVQFVPMAGGGDACTASS